jgi:hypothetical protein
MSINPFLYNNSKSKTLATLGLGNIKVGNKQLNDKKLNRYISKTKLDLYDVKLDVEISTNLDTRMLTKYDLSQVELEDRLLHAAIGIVNKDDNYIDGTDNPQYKKQIEDDREYLKMATSDKIIDNYQNSEFGTPPIKQQMLTTESQEEYESSDYNMGYKSQALENQGLPIFSVARVGQVVGKSATTIAPSVFNGGKIVVQKSGKVYDDVTLGMTKQVNKIAPKTTNNFLNNPTNYTQGGMDAVESYLPGVQINSKWGRRGFVGSQIYDNKDVVIEYVKDLLNTTNPDKE